MIRYVPVGEAIYNEDEPNYEQTRHSFAWYCTSSDVFLMFDGEHVFTDWNNFVEAYVEANQSSHGLERFERLMPKGAVQYTWDRRYNLFMGDILVASATTKGCVSKKWGQYAHLLKTHHDGRVTVDEDALKGRVWRLEEQ